MNSLVTVDCGCNGYKRERWCGYWRQFMGYMFDTEPLYDYNGSKIYWVIYNADMRETMTTIWSLKEQGYRTSCAGKVKTFFWVDQDFYRQNSKEILQWAERYNCKVPSREHGWIEMPDDRIETLFRLTWAGKSYG